MEESRSADTAAAAPALDILIPHYNDPAGLDLSLASIRDQTWNGSLRVLVVDDGSESAAWEAVQALCGRCGLAVTLLRNDRNLGRPGTRNRLLRESRAPYLAWLDAGDVWHPEKLAQQFLTLSELAARGVDLTTAWVTCAYHMAQPGGTSLVQQDTSGDQLLNLMQGDRLRAYLWTLLGRAEAFGIAGTFDEKLPRMQDLDYFVRFVRSGGRLHAPAARLPLCTYYKSDVGRSARQVYQSYSLIIDKTMPALRSSGAGSIKAVRYKAANLGFRFAMNNRNYGFALRCKLAALGVAPRHALMASLKMLARRMAPNA